MNAHKKRSEELGGKLEQLEEELKENEKKNMIAESSLKNVKDSKKQEEKKKVQIEKKHEYGKVILFLYQAFNFKSSTVKFNNVIFIFPFNVLELA